MPKTVEASGTSSRSLEDAVRHALGKLPGAGCRVREASVRDIRVSTGADGGVIEWRVQVRVSGSVG